MDYKKSFNWDTAKDELLKLAKHLGVRGTIAKKKIKGFDWQGVDIFWSELTCGNSTIKHRLSDEEIEWTLDHDSPLETLLTACFQLGMENGRNLSIETERPDIANKYHFTIDELAELMELAKDGDSQIGALAQIVTK